MIPNRANYGGKTRRTSKIHWQKGRSTVTGQYGQNPASIAPMGQCPVSGNTALSH